jgi:tetratricopeptide (TPR) repeat protein
LRLAETRQTGREVDLLGPAADTVVYLTGPLPARVTIAGSDLGQLLAAEGKFEEAEGAYKKALEYAESAYSSDNIMRAIPLRGLAEVEYRLNHTKPFEKHTQQLFEIISKNPGYESAYVKPLWLKFKLESEQQSPRSIDTLKMIEKVFEKQHFDYSEFGRSAMAVSVKPEQAQDALLKVADSYTASAPEKAGLILAAIANSAAEHNKPELADAMYLRVVESQKNAPDKGILIAALEKLGERKIAAGKRAEAAPFYHEVTAAMRQKYGNDMRVADAMDTEAALLKEIGQEEAAKKLQADAMELRKKIVFK